LDGVDLGRPASAATRPLRRRMQLVFQDPYSSLDPRRRVGAQIADGLAIHKHVGDAGDERRRVEAMLDQVGLDPSHAHAAVPA
jgi:ABC-type microcin C transport system duplicated ATPase subunit YejF